MTRSSRLSGTPARGQRRVVGYHRPMMMFRIALLATAWIVAGCSAAAPSRDTGSLTPASVTPSLIPDGSAAASRGPFDLPASIVDPVVAEIARLAGVPVDQVTVLSAESVTFPDGGLGCPVPGMVYIQVQVDGFKIVAEAGGNTYDFRGSGGTFRQCDPKVRPSATTP